MKYIFTTLLVSFTGLVGFGQQQIPENNTIEQVQDSLEIASATLVAEQNELLSKIDTIIVDGKHQRIIKDSSLYALRDYSQAVKVDQLDRKSTRLNSSHV